MTVEQKVVLSLIEIAVRSSPADLIKEDLFTYVGDNLKKDFIAPYHLGWMTICLKDDGRNIHRKEVDDIEEGMMPKRWIYSFVSIR